MRKAGSPVLSRAPDGASRPVPVGGYRRVLRVIFSLGERSVVKPGAGIPERAVSESRRLPPVPHVCTLSVEC